MEEIIKRTKSLGVLLIKPVVKKLAKEMIINNHYSHKWNDGGFGKFNFGIFKENEPDCLGVAVYGYMKNPRAKIFTHPNPDGWMCELNRLWINDDLGHNAESLLIGASLRLLKSQDVNIVAVQSFADGRLGCGTIYKASNFKYYGHHYTKFLKNKKTGEFTHEQNFTNSTATGSFLLNNIHYLVGNTEVFQVKTHRYIYPLCKKFKFTLKREQDYPLYSKGMDKVVWKRNHTLLADKMVKFIYELV